MFENRFKLYSSMEKVMIYANPEVEELQSMTVLKNERFSFQIAYEYEPEFNNRTYPVSFEIKSPLKDCISARKVVHIPSEMPLYPGKKDDSVISDKPGLFPDLLKPFVKNEVWPHETMHDAIWFTVEPEGNYDAGTYEISVEFKYEKKSEEEGKDPVVYKCTKTLKVEIIDVMLPEQTFRHTQWFHADCIASHYQIETFSERHWEIIENFMKVAVRNGQDTSYPPIYTPPLDTAIGGERPTTQLLGIELKDGNYTFDFTLVDRWIDLSLKLGFKYFSMPHLFTQWGAKYCPIIMATVDGEYKRIFGWDCSSTDERYRHFLSQYLPAILDYVEKKGIRKVTSFNYSDEPGPDALEQYKAAVAGAAKYLEGSAVSDALSHVDYHEAGVLSNIATPTYRAQEFFDKGIRDISIYYCSGHKD